MSIFSLKLTNNLSKREVILNNLKDSERSNMFYHFRTEIMESFEEGEYTYELINEDNKVVATGLLQVGDYERDTNINTEYKNNKSDIIVYDGN